MGGESERVTTLKCIERVFYFVLIEGLWFCSSESGFVKRLERNGNGFRQQFLKFLPNEGDAFAELVVRLASYFERWLEL